ncbi:MAG TPA: hypothetical protein VH234_00925 [Candidatus Saccharimonadales bacterium]|nr:hypothetical protein [Candidatus Saccharimonadales bacterium]
MSELHRRLSAELDTVDEQLDPGLCICAECASSFIGIVRDEEAENGQYNVSLGCKDCGNEIDGQYDPDMYGLLELRTDLLDQYVNQEAQRLLKLEKGAARASMQQDVMALKEGLVGSPEFFY